MPEYAVARRDWTPGSSPAENLRLFEAWLDRRRRENPGYQLPAGYETHGGHVERDTHGLLQDLAKYLPYVGFAAAGGLGLAGATSASSAGAATVPDIATTTGMDGLSFGGGTAAAGGGSAVASGAGAAGGSHVAGSIFDQTIPHTGLTGRDATGLGALALSLFGGNGNAEPPQNAAMTDLVRLQTERLRQADPLYQAVLRMAMGLLPTSMRGALPGQAATPPMPTMPAQPRHR